MSKSDKTRVVFGYHPVCELLRHRPGEVVELLCSAKPGKRRQAVEALCRENGLPLSPAAGARLDFEASGQAHNGFVALVRGGAEGARPGPDPDLWVLVEDIQDARNLGALLRVCEGAGVAKVLVRDRGSAPLTAGAIKTSAGAAEWQPMERITNSAQEIERLQKQGFWAYGADADGSAPWNVDLTGKVLLCIGGEADGLRERTRKTCDGLVGLPMRGKVASLNLATAASALLYEAVRQRSIAAKA